MSNIVFDSGKNGKTRFILPGLINNLEERPTKTTVDPEKEHTC